jgi:FixJ family two-component response regulator
MPAWSKSKPAHNWAHKNMPRIGTSWRELARTLSACCLTDDGLLDSLSHEVHQQSFVDDRLGEINAGGDLFSDLLPVGRSMTTTAGIVYLLDDDASTVKGLTRLLRVHHFEVRGFTSVRAFLDAFRPQDTACLVLDVAMPELDGLELQQRLTHQGVLIPIIFLTGHGDVPMSVSAMKAGATDFLTKSVDGSVLVRAVRTAIQIAQIRHQTAVENAALAARFANLSPREREVMEHVVAGRLNKQIAADLEIAEPTIKVHRGRVMEKMKVQSLPDLVRAAQRLGLGNQLPPQV